LNFKFQCFGIPNFLSNLSKRFGSFLNNDLWLMVTVLDARYKTITFENNKTVVKQCLQKIKIAMLDSFEVETSLSSSDDEVEECEASGSSLWNVQREILKRKPAQQNVKKERRVALELTEYLQIRPNMSLNSIQFWMQTTRFKHLQPLALKLLQTTATSVPSERMFSKADNIMTDKRSRLKPDSIH
jgi:zinc finger BED domain-containing protein 1 (E3 SUMO-protein ligase ZBED1)